ncbi:hypothetical protein GE09DRAFT_760089 [Coniochaeta sp. 2T2.1]|nr:hypothetical protein GE09DRAFT_760089 [Coniochaeta sp. 2T2.1]
MLCSMLILHLQIHHRSNRAKSRVSTRSSRALVAVLFASFGRRCYPQPATTASITNSSVAMIRLHMSATPPYCRRKQHNIKFSTPTKQKPPTSIAYYHVQSHMTFLFFPARFQPFSSPVGPSSSPHLTTRRRRAIQRKRRPSESYFPRTHHVFPTCHAWSNQIRRNKIASYHGAVLSTGGSPLIDWCFRANDFFRTSLRSRWCKCTW